MEDAPASRLNVIVPTSTMRILVISSLSPSLSGVQSMQLCCRWKMSWTGGTLNITWKSASAGSKCCVLFILTWFVNAAELELSADSSRAILSQQMPYPGKHWNFAKEIHQFSFVISEIYSRHIFECGPRRLQRGRFAVERLSRDRKSVV